MSQESLRAKQEFTREFRASKKRVEDRKPTKAREIRSRLHSAGEVSISEEEADEYEKSQSFTELHKVFENIIRRSSQDDVSVFLDDILKATDTILDLKGVLDESKREVVKNKVYNDVGETLEGFVVMLNEYKKNKADLDRVKQLIEQTVKESSQIIDKAIEEADSDEEVDLAIDRMQLN